MTLLRVHDDQQSLTKDFVKLARMLLNAGNVDSEKRQEVFLQGQEMGFCNDEIRILLEDAISK